MDTDVARERLQATLEELDSMQAELTDEQDPSDRPDTSALDTSDAAQALQTVDREVQSLEVIEAQRERVVAALERIAAGTYGRCIDCGKQIEDARLDARPEAARCLEDQQKYDASGATA